MQKWTQSAPGSCVPVEQQNAAHGALAVTVPSMSSPFPLFFLLAATKKPQLVDITPWAENLCLFVVHE